MGRTLLGIDLDESPVGGLIESLLSEEDLEKLADGGRAPGDDSTDEDADASDDGAASEGDTADPTAGTDLVDDAVEADDGTAEATDDDGTTVPVGTSDESDVPWETPSPGVDATGLAETPSPGDESGADEGGDWKATLRPLLLKGAIALVLLAVVALVVYRYLGTIKDVAGDRLPTDRFGSDETEDAPAESPTEDFGGDSPAARRRAKTTDTDEADESSDFTTELGGETDDSDEGIDTDTSEEEPETVGRPTDSDTGALVGLAMLALVAALVRKFGEQREYDPLVDGPRDDDD